PLTVVVGLCDDGRTSNGKIFSCGRGREIAIADEWNNCHATKDRAANTSGFFLWDGKRACGAAGRSAFCRRTKWPRAADEQSSAKIHATGPGFRAWRNECVW